MRTKRRVLLLGFFIGFILFSNLLSITPLYAFEYWPRADRDVNGVLGEYRGPTGTPHFHGGIDMPNQNGQPVYSVEEVQQKQVETGKKGEEKGEKEAKAVVAKEAKSETREPKLIWSKEFESGIKDADILIMKNAVAFSDVFKKEEGVEGIAKAPAKTVFPIKAMVMEEAVKFFDEEGNVTNEIPLEEYVQDYSDKGGSVFRAREDAIVSPNGERIVKIKYGYESVEEMKLYDRNGSFLNFLDAGFGDSLVFLTEGVVVIDEVFGGIAFFDNQGNFKKRFESLLPIWYTDSPDGKYIAVFASEGKGLHYLFLFDNKGNQIWKWKCRSGNVMDIDISSDGSYIAVAFWFQREKRVRVSLLNKEQELLQEYDLPFERGNIPIALSSDGSSLVVGITNHLYFFDNTKGRLLWEYKGLYIWTATTRPKPISISEEGNIIAINGKRDNRHFLQVLDRKGDLLWEQELSEYFPSPRGEVLQDGRILRINGKKKFSVYDISGLGR